MIFLKVISKLSTALKIFSLVLVLSCSQDEGGFLTETPFENIIVISSSSTTHRGITAYDLDGNLIKVITDFRADGGTPRSTVHLGDGNFLTVQDNPDKATKYDFKTATKSNFIGTNFFSGTIMDSVVDSRGNIYVAETHAIEKFNSSGNREPLQTGNAFIQGTIGVCALNNARGLFMTEDDILIVASFTSGDIVIYDVSTETPQCLSSVSVGAEVNGVMLHSNGSLYFTRFNTDEIYRAAPDGSGAILIWPGDITKINNPADLVELPDGTILVAGLSNHQIWRIDEDGAEVGTNPFIVDAQTSTIRDIEIILSEDN